MTELRLIINKINTVGFSSNLYLENSPSLQQICNIELSKIYGYLKTINFSKSMYGYRYLAGGVKQESGQGLALVRLRGS